MSSVQEWGFFCLRIGHLCPGIGLNFVFSFVAITPLLFEDCTGKYPIL